MKLKYFFTNVLNVGQPAKSVVKRKPNKLGTAKAKAVRGGIRTVDLELLQPSPRLTAEDIEARIRKGRVAEMSLHSAGIK